jgi:5'-nucleotidase
MDSLRPIKRIYIDMDGVICDYVTAYKQALIDNPNQPYPQSQAGFFLELLPLTGAIDCIQMLQKNYEVWILTSPSVYNISCYSEKAHWVRKYLGFEMQKRMIISTDKSLLKGHYLIDDQTTNNQSKFEGKHIHFGTDKFPDWESVIEFLELELVKVSDSKKDLWWGC